ncbi:AraC family transcriptional regulator [Marinobacter maroccanus]|uniref:AraC family transcriptional regulator n=1 Tax=Marinobacter maroccanus TaxID=2055143 RepID=A0A2S5ZD46_9GAMM|nr:AraC family transcriptional regulator [Marinobacter maroccanus]PPI85307.1 AraC family transcriptional regulator [Marinobacter maroccanus]
MHTFSRADFERFGQLYDIEFRFPAIHGDNSTDDYIVARGEITEHSLASGFRFTFSSLEVLEAYDSVSCGHAPLLVLVVLDGIVRLTLGSVEHELTPGTAVSMQLHPDYPLQAHQPEQQHLEIMALAFDPRRAKLGHVSPSLHGLTILPRMPLRQWKVPHALQQLLRTYAGLTMTGTQKNLVLEGVALQLAGLGLGSEEQESPDVPVVPVQQRQRLELVRQHLEFTPDHDHSLKDLAQMAAMSPSGLRAKFRAMYGVPVFDYLRKCRLQLAKHYLEQGFSVEQCANKVGYTHATNFSTAFRREFGFSPRQRTVDQKK